MIEFREATEGRARDARRRRVLLVISGKTYHLTREEAVELERQLRRILATRRRGERRDLGRVAPEPAPAVPRESGGGPMRRTRPSRGST